MDGPILAWMRLILQGQGPGPGPSHCTASNGHDPELGPESHPSLDEEDTHHS